MRYLPSAKDDQVMKSEPSGRRFATGASVTCVPPFCAIHGAEEAENSTFGFPSVFLRSREIFWATICPSPTCSHSRQNKSHRSPPESSKSVPSRAIQPRGVIGALASGLKPRSGLSDTSTEQPRTGSILPRTVFTEGFCALNVAII